MIPSSPPGDPGVMADPAPGRLLKKSSDYLAQLEGNVLVVSRGAKLRGVCLKCGSHHELTLRTVHFTRLLALPPTLRRAELGIPLCVSCNKRWTAGTRASAAAIAAFAASIVALCVTDDPRKLLALCIVLFITCVLVARAYAIPRMLVARKMDDKFVDLSGAHPNAAQEIAEGSVR